MEVERELVLDAPPDEVWDALTEPSRLAEWFANDVELDLRPGGGASFRWGNGEERHGRSNDQTSSEQEGDRRSAVIDRRYSY